MTAAWADEKPNHEPDPRLEPFYILAALELGDPDGERWIERNAPMFYSLYVRYHEQTKCRKYLGAEVLLQYIFWYERDKPKDKVDTRKT